MKHLNTFLYFISFFGLTVQSVYSQLVCDGRYDPNEGYTYTHYIYFPNAGQNSNDPPTSGWVGAENDILTGFLALGTDPTTGNHFMYYALPKGYVDNTYNWGNPTGSGTSGPPVVGVYEQSGGGHYLGTGLIGSDNFGVEPFELYYTDPGNKGINPNGPLDYFRFTADYLADVKTSGTRTDIMSAGAGGGVDDALPAGASQWDRNDGNNGNLDDHLQGPSHGGTDQFTAVWNVATSMEWNINTYGPTGTNAITADDIANLSGYLNASPDVVRDTTGPDPTLAVLAADGYSYQPADPLFPDWIYEVAYEFEFDSCLFGPEWATGNGDDPFTLLNIPTPHASPNKGISGQGDPGDEVLPVELTSFSVNLISGSSAELVWETATEVNNYGFEIEKSSEVENWKKIAFVEGHGNSNSPKFYSFTDKNLFGGTKFYYRLKQIDIDGQYEYSGVINISLNLSDISYELNQNYPNPFNPSTTISFTLPEQTDVKLTVYNIFGEKVAGLVNDVKDAGTHTVVFNAEDLASGMYFYTIEAKNYSSTKKLVLLK